MTPEKILPLFHVCLACSDPSCAILYGECHCGCRGKTKVAVENDASSLKRIGFPARYINGHNKRISRPKSELINIGGIDYRTIPLTKGQVAIVDVIDYIWLSQWVWFASWSVDTGSFYAFRKITNGPDKGKSISMHRQILGLQFGDERRADHLKTKDTLNNTRQNLRIGSHQENCFNRGKNSNNTSGFKGVSLTRNKEKWRARITIDGIEIYLGETDTPQEAHKLYCDAAALYHGKFSRVA